ncbi:ParA family protein [Spartinivicinus poritis]|uniref:AAA family ATPase n=1 Tax=Spartinivicinus poritis TaxID=2994640 RepID=A0ABT5U280_9GAMM|nr:AAA family ATPase [Spartinivicinus sp. A2-2]MDE1460473.1 AAA family ATPase [Spartinivicinus sp. A2-2]
MKIIAVYSIKGGVGKTAAAVNLAYEASQAGYQTLLCDLDPQGASSFYFRVSASKKQKSKWFFSQSYKLFQHIKASDYPLLDILPAKLSYRHFDIKLGAFKKSPQKQIAKLLKPLKKYYDVIFLDCPPSISLLSENVFHTADIIMVPVIPTTLSERTLNQLVNFFQEKSLDKSKIHPFFSMAQASKKLHQQSEARIKTRFNSIISQSIPFCAEIENMGIHQKPVAAFAPKKSGAIAYQTLWKKIESYYFT